MTIATAAEVQSNFNRFLNLVQKGSEVVILRDGVEVARLVSKQAKSVSDSLVGVLSVDIDDKAARAERIQRHADTH